MLRLAEAIYPKIDAFLFLEEDWQVAVEVERQGKLGRPLLRERLDAVSFAHTHKHTNTLTLSLSFSFSFSSSFSFSFSLSPFLPFSLSPFLPLSIQHNTTQHNTTKHAHTKALALLQSRSADVVRLRNRKVPGHPHCSSEWRGRENEILRVVSPDVANHTVLETGYWLSDPSATFPGLVWQCNHKWRGRLESVLPGSAEESNPNVYARDLKRHFCTGAPFAGWSNNPFLVRRSWWLGNVGPVAAADFEIFEWWPARSETSGRRGDKGRLEAAINLAPHLWDDRGYVVAHGEGLFSHADIDRHLAVQSPCQAPDTVPLFPI